MDVAYVRLIAFNPILTFIIVSTKVRAFKHVVEFGEDKLLDPITIMVNVGGPSFDSLMMKSFEVLVVQFVATFQQSFKVIKRLHFVMVVKYLMDFGK